MRRTTIGVVHGRSDGRYSTFSTISIYMVITWKRGRRKALPTEEKDELISVFLYMGCTLLGGLAARGDPQLSMFLLGVSFVLALRTHLRTAVKRDREH